MNKIIETNSLNVTLSSKPILNNLTLSVPEGTICALLGPNGAGKSTLIKTLVNIHPIKSGTAKILGKNSDQLVAEDFKKIGYVSESQELPLWMTVEKFLAFCSSLYEEWDHEWSEKMLQEMKLQSSLGTPLSDLSRGMRVKASLISSLAYKPDLLILDEPFSGLDPVVRDDFIEAVIQLASDKATTTFISSHDLSEVERIADSIAFLNYGTIISHDTLDNLLQKYKKLTVHFKSSGMPKNLPKTWRNIKRSGESLQLVDSEFDPEKTRAFINNFGGELSEVLEMNLKDIYRSVISEGF